MEFWIARRKSKKLYLFFGKPQQIDNGRWFILNNNYVDRGIKIDENLFPEITFENSPKQVKIELL